jgi:hypothetical protein
MNYMNYCTSLPMSNINMFSSRGGQKTGSARGMPATTRRGRDADEALPCGDGMADVNGVHKHALPLVVDLTGRTSIGHTGFVPASGQSGDPRLFVSTHDVRQHSGDVDVRHCMGGQSFVGSAGPDPRTSGFAPSISDRPGAAMRSQVTGSQRSTRHSRSSSIQRSPRNQRSQAGSDSHKQADPAAQRSNRSHRSPAGDSRRSPDPTSRGQRTNAGGPNPSGQEIAVGD